jgi:putative endopeptidase
MSLSEGKEENMAKAVLALETEMAKVFMDKNDLRDPHKTYNYMSTEDLQKIIPAVDVKTYFKNIGLQTIDSLNVGQPDYVKGLNKILQSTDLQTVKAYLALQVVNDAAPYLSNDFVQTNFDFYGKTLSGKTEMKPRWKRVVSTVDGCLGEAVGQMYVEKYFPAEAKERMLKLVDNLKEALGERIAQNTWMTDQTKAKAKEKLSTLSLK